EVIDRILDVARRAPSAGFSQGVDFVVLDTPETIAEFWRITEDPAFPMDPEEIAVGPTVIVLPIADKRPYLARYAEPDKIAFGLDHEARWPVKFWEIDAAMASMLALLAAVDEGLGGFFFGIDHGERELLDRFGVPEGIRPVGILGFGYRAQDEGPAGSGAARKRRPLADQIHRNGW
ncbi:MAG: nitroreductase family protein, partial [Actinomycetota bacterium]